MVTEGERTGALNMSMTHLLGQDQENARPLCADVTTCNPYDQPGHLKGHTGLATCHSCLWEQGGPARY